MDLNLRLYLFSDRELNYFIIFDIYNMHLSFFFLDHCYFKDVMHAWQGNTKEQRFFSILHKRFYKSLDFIWQDYCPLLWYLDSIYMNNLILNVSYIDL